MKKIIPAIVVICSLIASCTPAKRVINNAISPKDTSNILKDQSIDEAQIFAQEVKDKMQKNYIDFKTFSSKIKVESQDGKGKNPDITAVVRIVKDSAIWISLSATFLNVEVYRAYITKDSVILLDKREKTVQYRSLDYLQEVTQIPFDFITMQNILVGNPVFFNEKNATYKRADNYIQVNSSDEHFKNLMTLLGDNFQVSRIKLDDIDITRNRTANVSYGEYETYNGINFATNRQISIAEKGKLDVQMKFKQFEFNKDLSVAFTVPKNYKRK